jgi:hypothetical protein
MRNIFDFPDRILQPGAIQTVSVEIPAYVREIVLGRVEMAAIAGNPTFAMLDVMQIIQCSLDDSMSTRPISLLRSSRIPSGQNQPRECEIRQYVASHVVTPVPEYDTPAPDLFRSLYWIFTSTVFETCPSTVSTIFAFPDPLSAAGSGTFT